MRAEKRQQIPTSSIYTSCIILFEKNPGRYLALTGIYCDVDKTNDPNVVHVSSLMHGITIKEHGSHRPSMRSRSRRYFPAGRFVFIS